MNIDRLFRSKGVLLANVILLSLIVGFFTSYIVFSRANATASAELSYANARARALPVRLTDLEAVQQSFREVAAVVQPVVVEVRVVVPATRGQDGRNAPFRFFGPFNDNQERSDQTSLGSGIIVRHVGQRVFVLTNNHVVGETGEVTVALHDGREFEATTVGSDPRRDLAIISFETRDLDIAVATFGDSDELFVGDPGRGKIAVLVQSLGSAIPEVRYVVFIHQFRADGLDVGCMRQVSVKFVAAVGQVAGPPQVAGNELNFRTLGNRNGPVALQVGSASEGPVCVFQTVRIHQRIPHVHPQFGISRVSPQSTFA